MDEEQASVAYWKAVELLREVIDSRQRGDLDYTLSELEDDLGRRKD